MNIFLQDWDFIYYIRLLKLVLEKIFEVMFKEEGKEKYLNNIV